MKNYSVDDKLCALSLMLALCAIVIFTAALCVSSNNEGALPAAADVTPPQIIGAADMLIYVFGDLCEEGKIHCNCKDGGDYLCEKDKDCVRISCKKCGASLEVEAEDSPATHAVLHANEIYLN